MMQDETVQEMRELAKREAAARTPEEKAAVQQAWREALVRGFEAERAARARRGENQPVDHRAREVERAETVRAARESMLGPLKLGLVASGYEPSADGAGQMIPAKLNPCVYTVGLWKNFQHPEIVPMVPSENHSRTFSAASCGLRSTIEINENRCQGFASCFCGAQYAMRNN